MSFGVDKILNSGYCQSKEKHGKSLDNLLEGGFHLVKVCAVSGHGSPNTCHLLPQMAAGCAPLCGDPTSMPPAACNWTPR